MELAQQGNEVTEADKVKNLEDQLTLAASLVESLLSLPIASLSSIIDTKIGEMSELIEELPSEDLQSKWQDRQLEILKLLFEKSRDVTILPLSESSFMYEGASSNSDEEDINNNSNHADVVKTLMKYASNLNSILLLENIMAADRDVIDSCLTKLNLALNVVESSHASLFSSWKPLMHFFSKLFLEASKLPKDHLDEWTMSREAYKVFLCVCYETTELLRWSLSRKSVLGDLLDLALVEQLMAATLAAFTDLVAHRSTVRISGFLTSHVEKAWELYNQAKQLLVSEGKQEAETSSPSSTSAVNEPEKLEYIATSIAFIDRLLNLKTIGKWESQLRAPLVANIESAIGKMNLVLHSLLFIPTSNFDLLDKFQQKAIDFVTRFYVCCLVDEEREREKGQD